ncbi:MAG: phosphate ABC transporter permease subunit PstC [Pseudomonadota bacterium]
MFHADRWLAPLLATLACVTALVLLLILGFLWNEAWPVLTEGGWRRFIDAEGWYPLEGSFGLLPMLWATLAASFGALLLATPIGLASAIFVRFYAPQSIAGLYRNLLSLLAGIPSVVYGLWGLTVLVPIIAHWRPPGASLLAAILILALMILPTIALTSISALSAVPTALLQGAASLGLTRKGMILGVALPTAHEGIVGGIMLAMARALGETMAVLMVAGNVVQTPSSLFDSVRVLTANIALEMAYATGQHRAGLFASGMLLTLLVVLLAWWAAHAAGETRHG